MVNLFVNAVDKTSDAYAAGQAAGQIFMVVVLVVVLLAAVGGVIFAIRKASKSKPKEY